MATKRPAPHVHASRRDQVPNEPRRKRQKPDNAGPKSFKKAHPVNELKSQIRSLKRLLEHNEKLPATIRAEKERALQTAQYELRQAEQAKSRSEMIGRYHKTRFFERQKATKRLKKARKELQTCEDGDGRRAELEKKVADAEVDVNYPQYYPLERHYVPLFPRKQAKEVDDDGDDDDALEDQAQSEERQGDQEMLQKVRQCMADGTLEALRNGKLTKPQEQPEINSTEANYQLKGEKRSRSGRESNAAQEIASKEQDIESANESDGGFFE